MKDKGLALADDARILLSETIREISTAKNFRGFMSVEHLVNGILYDVLTSDLKGIKQISANMIARYDKHSDYVRRAKFQFDTKKSIGFISEEYEK
jgi:hypothetical protein